MEVGGMKVILDYVDDVIVLGNSRYKVTQTTMKQQNTRVPISRND